MNIIFPIGGKGQRFKDKGYVSEKAFINFLGHPILFWILNNLSLNENDKIFFLYNTQRYNQDFFDNLMNKNFTKIQYKTFPIVKETNGAAETVYEFLKCSNALNNEESFLILDCDNFYTDDLLKNLRNEKNHLVFYSKIEKHNNEFSFISLDENNTIIQIKEKVGISNNICTGAYFFNSVKKFKESYQLISSEKEIYISNVYEVLIQNKEKVKASQINIKDYHCLGTPNKLINECLEYTNLNEKKIFCFDLDGTLVKFPTEIGNYETCEPIHKNIEFLKNLKKSGHKIIIFTARKMKTANNNQLKAKELAEAVVLETLKKYEILYDELIFGKPYADFYIDDLAINAYNDLEKETGFYFENIIGRNENKVEIHNSSCIKTTNNTGEIYFYNNIPEQIKIFFPNIKNISNNVIEMEKINGTTFSFLFNNDLINKSLLNKLLSVIDSIHSIDAKESKKTNIIVNDIYTNKLTSRINQEINLLQNENLNDESFAKMVSRIKSHEENIDIFHVIHGDPVFTNIFLTENEQIKFIDPRGKVGNINTIYGDRFYDYAKIYQSLLGYDIVVCNKHLFLSKEKLEIINFFEEHVVNKFGYDNLCLIKDITKCLLISLLPLHKNKEHKVQFINLYKSIQ